MNLKYTIIKIGDIMKPAVTKIIPIGICKKIKDSMIKSCRKKIVKRKKFNTKANQFGVNLLGYITSPIGLGQGARLTASALSAAAVPFMIYDIKSGANYETENEWEYKIGMQLKYQINIIHINPDVMPVISSEISGNPFSERYNIGLWLWELSEIPESWKGCHSLVDEIWTPSEFTAKCLRKNSDIPVNVIPYGIIAETDEKYNREYFGFSENKFIFLTMYDTKSTIERKNPLASVKAFKLAFKFNDEKVCLAVKINNCSKEDRKKLKKEIADYRNIIIIDNNMNKKEVNSLIKISDALVSLHRAEGFGLVLAEAMLLGTPVIATNYSANTEFMDNTNSCAVSYKMIKIGQNVKIYSGNQVWADPDLCEASEYMKKLVNDKKFYNKIKEKAQADIRNNFSINTAAEKIKKRIFQISAENAKK